MRLTYRGLLDNNMPFTIEANNCGEAISDLLWKFRGRKVSSIHSGYTKEEQNRLNQVDSRYIGPPGIIHYEVPQHDAIPKDAVKPKAIRRLVDETEKMFADTEMAGGRLAD